MSTKYIEITTMAGDRWDLIAHRHYGDALKDGLIVAANPHVPITPVLEGGIRIVVPLVERPVIEAESDLPPWKR